MREAQRFVFACGAVVGFILFASLSYEVRFEDSRAESRKTERQTIGLWFSPWFVSTTTHNTKITEDNGKAARIGRETKVELLSWSWLVLAGAIASVAAYRRVCRKPTGGSV